MRRLPHAPARIPGTIAAPILGLLLAEQSHAEPHIHRLPPGALQPAATTDPSGDVHLVWLQGDPQAADVFHLRLPGGHPTTNAPTRVNSQPGSAVAVGTIRGAQVAIGPSNSVHVVWNGSSKAQPQSAGSAPLLYARSPAAGSPFTPQMNLGGDTAHLDGGASVAASASGPVHVVWHAAPNAKAANESDRRLFVRTSRDAGLSFGPATPAALPGGVCACCGLRTLSPAPGRLLVLYRAAHAVNDRPATLAESVDGGATFRVVATDPWDAGTCPMSAAALATTPTGVVVAWETRGQIRLRPATTGPSATAFQTVSEGQRNRHPALAARTDGRVLVAWAVGTGWQRGGSVAWREVSPDGTPAPETGTAPSLSVWSLPAAFTRTDGTFVVAY